MAKVTVCFTLDSEEDRDLVRWLDGLPKRGRSEAIRQVLRDHLSHSGVTLSVIYQAILDLKRQGFATGSGSDNALTDDEPSEAADNLAKLGL
jgi:hypothetical protein